MEANKHVRSVPFSLRRKTEVLRFSFSYIASLNSMPSCYFSSLEDISGNKTPAGIKGTGNIDNDRNN